MTAGVCVLPHRHEPDRPRRSTDGLHVCQGCLGRLEQTLAEMSADYTALAVRLTPVGSRGPNVTGTRERALPIDPMVADHRSDIAGKLSSWSALISEEREIHPPTATVERMSGWLLVHLRWSCAQPWIDEYAAELTAIRSRTMSLIQPSGRRRVDVGDCVEEGCDGVLTATIAPLGDLLPSEITCSHSAEHFWPTARWDALGRKIHGAAMFDERTTAAFLRMLGRAG